MPKRYIILTITFLIFTFNVMSKAEKSSTRNNDNTIYLKAQDQNSKFNIIGTYKGLGLIKSSIIASGPDPNSEYIYSAYTYDSFEIVAVNTSTGNATIFSSPLKDESAVYGMIEGADKNIYLATCPSGHLMRINWETKSIDDLGKILISEQYIFGLTAGIDKKIYGCTYPNAKLFSYDVFTKKIEDLGRMDSTEMYARSISSSNDGFIYIGVGFIKRHLIAYEIATRSFRDILPDSCKGSSVCWISKGNDEKVYASAGKYFLSMDKWNAKVTDRNQYLKTKNALTLKNGNKVKLNDSSVQVFASDKTSKEIKFQYNGSNINLFRITLGPDNNIYGSSVFPLNLVKLNPHTNTIETIGTLGEGEIYSFNSYSDKLMIFAYGAYSPIMVYKPGMNFNPKNSAEGNPWMLNYPFIDSGWRPFASIVNKNTNVYIGSMATYGAVGGSIYVMDQTNGNVKEYKNVVGNQSVFSLCNLPNNNIIGGTYCHGGMGTTISDKEAHIFIWDTKQNKKTFEMTPVPNMEKIDALIVGKKGIVYGFSGSYFFVFNSQTNKIIKTMKHSVGNVIYNAIGQALNGEIYGVSEKGVFHIDTKLNSPELIANYSRKITGGFAINKNLLYFIVGNAIVTYNLF